MTTQTAPALSLPLSHDDAARIIDALTEVRDHRDVVPDDEAAALNDLIGRVTAARRADVQVRAEGEGTWTVEVRSPDQPWTTLPNYAVVTRVAQPGRRGAHHFMWSVASGQSGWTLTLDGATDAAAAVIRARY